MRRTVFKSDGAWTRGVTSDKPKGKLGFRTSADKKTDTTTTRTRTIFVADVFGRVAKVTVPA